MEMICIVEFQLNITEFNSFREDLELRDVDRSVKVYEVAREMRSP